MPRTLNAPGVTEVDVDVQAGLRQLGVSWVDSPLEIGRR
jgi:hypothetical protein